MFILLQMRFNYDQNCPHFVNNTIPVFTGQKFRIFLSLSPPPSFFSLWRCDLTRVVASSFLRFLDHTKRRTTVGRTSLDE
jgi:hypothetical protein